MSTENLTAREALVKRITDYLSCGGLINPELAYHDSVRDLLIDVREALASQLPAEPSGDQVIEIDEDGKVHYPTGVQSPSGYRQGLEKAAACRSAVPVLPGEMPDEMWKILSTDRDVATEALRITVRQTLDEYEAAIRALAERIPQRDITRARDLSARLHAHAERIRKEGKWAPYAADELDEAARMLAEQMPQGESASPWRPIEEAPRDGTELLLTQWTKENGFGETDFGAWGFIEKSDADGHDIFGWLSNYGRVEEPTHFMLAAAPAQEKGKK